MGKSPAIFAEALEALYKKANIGHNVIMNTRNQDIQDQILLMALEDVPFDGWRWDVVEKAAEKAGFDSDMALAVFPEKLVGVLSHFSAWADRQMIDMLQGVDIEPMRIRDRVQLAVQKRLDILTPHKEAVRAATVFWLVPTRKLRAGKIIWQTADKIWDWAGDTATDYNRYTKRGLLSGVISATALRWLNDTSPDHGDTAAFLERWIEEVLKIGRFSGQILGRLGRFRNGGETHV